MDCMLWIVVILIMVVVAIGTLLRQTLSDHTRCILWMKVQGWQRRLRDFITGDTLPDRILNHVTSTAKRGDAESVLQAIDEHCNNKEWAMNVGPVKGEILDSIVRETAPTTVLELGTYLGYSAVRIARLLPPNGKLLTVECHPERQSYAKKIVSFAGLDDKVTFIAGDSKSVIPDLKKSHDIMNLDLVFIDHVKSFYLRDLKLTESNGLLRRGSVIVADNVLIPGAPDYLDYVRKSDMYKCNFYSSTVEYTQYVDGLEKSVYQFDS